MKIALFCYLIWSLWNQSNNKLRNNILDMSYQAIDQAKVWLDDWNLARCSRAAAVTLQHGLLFLSQIWDSFLQPMQSQLMLLPCFLMQGQNWSWKNRLPVGISVISVPLFQSIWIILLLGFVSGMIKVNSCFLKPNVLLSNFWCGYWWSSRSFIGSVTGSCITFMSEFD